MLCFDTQAVMGAADSAPYGAESMPIFQTTTFVGSEYSYSRTSNPTRTFLQERIATLECGDRGFAFSSGLAAVSALFSVLKCGDRAVISRDCYGGVYRLATRFYAKYGITFVFTDTTDRAALEEAMSQKTALLLVETPSNPLNKVTDIAFAAAAAKNAGAYLAVDNTFLTPYFQKPLTLGADAVLHSATKFLGGHHDSLAGLIATSNPALARHLTLAEGTLGNALSPFDCFLILRGIQTLHVRMDRHRRNALAAAEFLSKHPAIDSVMYPELPASPYYDLAKSQASGGGGVVSFTLKDDIGDRISRMRFIRKAESLGGCQTLITHPATQTHASLPADERLRLGITDRLLRLSVGIESASDILSDLSLMLE